MSDLVLVVWKDTWADEMDLAGWEIMEKSTWETVLSNVRDYDSHYTMWVGTNECIEYGSSKSCIDHMGAIAITEADAAGIKILTDITTRENFFPTDLISALKVGHWEDEEYY